jgi:hypothetical protein
MPLLDILPGFNTRSSDVYPNHPGSEHSDGLSAFLLRAYVNASRKRPPILTDIYRGFPQPFQPNSRTLP